MQLEEPSEPIVTYTLSSVDGRVHSVQTSNVQIRTIDGHLMSFTGLGPTLVVPGQVVKVGQPIAKLVV